MAVLINGDGYGPVTAQQDADLYAGILGNDLVVLNVGEKMAASIQSSTVVRIADGEAVCQGRRIHIDAGSYDDFTIPTGTQGVEAQYCIGYHLYQDANNNELCETFVSAYSASLLTPAVLRDGNTESYITMYIVTQNGITLSAVDAAYNLVSYVPRQKVDTISTTSLYPTRVGTTHEYMSVPALANYNMVLVDFEMHNCHQLLVFVRPVDFYALVSDYSVGTKTYVRGGCHVDWTNNAIGIRCTDGTSAMLSLMRVAKIYGVC